MATDSEFKDEKDDVVVDTLGVGVGDLTPEQPVYELEDILRDTYIARWSRSSMMLYLSVFASCCVSATNGFDGSLMTAIEAMPYFQSQFDNVGTTGPRIALIFAMYTVGAIVGSPFAAIVSDRFGRRKGMLSGCILIWIGMIIAATSKAQGQLIAARFILGFGVTHLIVAGPAYSMEIAPPHWRGRCTGMYNVGYYAGAIPAAAVTFGTNYISSNLSWQIPLVCQAVPTLILATLTFVIPESPRFLMAQGRVNDAREFLVRYHGNGDPNSRLAAFELREMSESIKTDGADKRWWDYRPLFATRSGRWRMSQVLMISIFGQFSGNGLTYFNTVIYAELGVNTVPQQLGYNILSNATQAISAITGALLMDRLPRRGVLIWCTFGVACLLAISAALSEGIAIQEASGQVSTSIAQGSLATFFLFNCLFAFSYTPLQAIVPVEALDSNMRAKGMAAMQFIVSIIGFINTYAIPISLHNIGYRTAWIFVGWDFIETIAWYFFGVESRGRSLEELQWLYDQPNPVKASKVRTKTRESTGDD